MKFGKWLRQLRTQRGLSIRALANSVKVDHSYISRIESDRAQPSEQTIRKLAKILRYDEAELMILGDRIPPKWRSVIKKAPHETASLIRESFEEYGERATELETTSFPLSNGIQTGEAERRSEKPKRKSPAGVSTNDLVFSAHIGTNDDLFPKILSLYVAEGSTVADVTYGRGVFWKNVPKDRYRLLATDINNGVDCRSLPYEDNSVDCVVFDPPYMHTPGGTAHLGHQNYEGYYRNNSVTNGSGKKYHEAVLDLYFAAGAEVCRILRNNGIFIVKCADEVCANQQRLTHVEIIQEYINQGLIVEDLFVLFRQNRPGMSRVLKQVHARKNHSYFLVLRKSNGKGRWKGPRMLSSQR